MRFLPVLLLAGMLLLNGCAASGKRGQDGRLNSADLSPAERIMIDEGFRIRFREISVTKMLKAAVVLSGPPSAYEIDGKLCGSEVERIRLIGDLAGWQVTFLRCTELELPGILRSGKADLGFGGFTEKQAEEWNFSACLPHKSGGEEKVFLVPRKALDLKSALEKL